MNRLLITTAVTLATFALTACSANTAEQTPKFDTTAMDTVLSSAVINGELVGVSGLVFDEGKTVYKGAFGLSDRERETPMDMDTVFRIYSMTKPITSVIIMDLIEDGKLSLSDPASKYIPELANMVVASMGEDGKPKFDPQANPMTIEDLLLHRAGLGYGIFGPMNPVEEAYMKAKLFDPSATMETTVKKITTLPLIGQPGAAWYYSLSIDVLGRIAEVVENKPLGEIMSERLFTPLGMTETGFRVRPDQVARFASNYNYTKDGLVLAEDGQNSPFANSDNKFESGGGGLVSTIGDVSKFAQMMLDGGTYNGHRVISEATVNTMMTPHMDADDTYLFPWLGGDTLSGFGYGGSVVYAQSDANQKTRGHAMGQWGWGGAARTNFWIDRKNNAFGIVMLQLFIQENPAIHDNFQALAYDQTRNDKPSLAAE